MTLDHGEYSISVSDNVISMKLIGSFNEYGVRSLFTEAFEEMDTECGCASQ